MAYNLRAKKTAAKVNKSGFSGPDSQYKPPRDHDEKDDEDYSQPEPYNYRQPTNSSTSQKQKKYKSSTTTAAPKKYLNLREFAESRDPGYEYVFDHSAGKYVKEKKKTKTVPVHKPVPEPEEVRKKKAKRKSVSAPQPESQPPKNKKPWSSPITLPSYFYPALTAILFGLLAAHYIGGSSSVQQTGVESWNPNPITQVANTIESSVMLPRRVLATGVASKERYKNFYGAVTEYCRHVTKGTTIKHRFVKRNTRKTPPNPPSWVERAVERVKRARRPRSWANVEYFWLRYGYFVARDEDQYPTREAGDICDDLQAYIRQLSGVDKHITTTAELEKSLTDLWPWAASTALSNLHGVLDRYFRDRARITGVRRDRASPAKTSNDGKVRADGAVVVEGNKFGAPVWALNVGVAYPIMLKVQDEFDDFKRVAGQTVERMRKMDALLEVMMALAGELLKHHPEEWLVWTKLPDEGVEGITEVMPGWGALSFKTLGLTRRI